MAARKAMKQKKQSGAQLMRAAGRVGLLVAMTADERELIRVAAAKAGLASSVWVRQLAVSAAKDA